MRNKEAKERKRAINNIVDENAKRQTERKKEL